MNNVFVYIETEGGKVADVSLELLTKGRELADRLGCKLEALALGHELKEMDKIVGRYGADTLWLADDAELAPYRTLPHTAVVCGIFEEEKPQIARFVRCRGAQTLREAGVDVRVYPELAEGVRRANAHLGR